jgi:hypothetical protein
MRAKLRLAPVLALLIAAAVGPARAGVVTYDVASLGGDQWRYDYAVYNDTLAAPLTWFTVFFALGSYDGLCDGDTSTGLCRIEPSAPEGWIAYVAQPEPDPLFDDGFFDLTTAGPGIAPGETLGGFSIQFHWLGQGTPGSQPFDFIGTDPANPLQSGLTTQRVTSVPEPGTLPLLALGLLGLVLYPRGLARWVARASSPATGSVAHRARARARSQRAGA